MEVSTRIKKGERIGQFAHGKTIALSSVAENDITVTIKPYNKEEMCRNAQLRLAWVFATYQARAHIGSGGTKEDCYNEFKFRFIAPVIAAEDADFARIYEKYSEWQLTPAHKVIARAVSHSDATVAQMASALTEYEHWLIDKGVQLKHPDYYQDAVNVR